MLATEPVSTTQVPWGNVGWSAGAGGVLAILAVAGALIANMSWLAGAKGPANQGLAAAASWKFSDSWASNLTAVTAAAAAIFTAISDKVSGLFSTGDLTGFSVGSTVFLLIAATAPLAYAALQSRPPRSGNIEPRGTVSGLALATCLTTSAVLGALSLVGLLIHGTTKVNDTVEDVAWVVLVAVAILMITYVFQSIGWLLVNAGKAKPTVDEEQKKPGVAPSAGHPGLVRVNGQRTMSLL